MEQLGRIAAAIMLAGVGAFMLLQAIRGWRNGAPPKADDDRHVEAAPD